MIRTITTSCPSLPTTCSLKLANQQLLQDARKAKEAGFSPKPVLVGPLTFLHLGKELDDCNRWDYLPDLLAVYAELISQLSTICEDIQIDEPIFCTELPPEMEARAQQVYQTLHRAAGPAKLMLATYFESVGSNLEWVAKLPVDTLHVDLARAPDQLADILAQWPRGQRTFSRASEWKKYLEKRPPTSYRNLATRAVWQELRYLMDWQQLLPASLPGGFGERNRTHPHAPQLAGLCRAEVRRTRPYKRPPRRQRRQRSAKPKLRGHRTAA